MKRLVPKIKRRYKVLGCWYKVIRDTPIYMNCDNPEDDEPVSAKVNRWDRIITIDSEIDDVAAFLSLVHEFAHLADPADLISEEAIAITTSILCQILLDNKMLKIEE